MKRWQEPQEIHEWSDILIKFSEQKWISCSRERKERKGGGREGERKREGGRERERERERAE